MTKPTNEASDTVLHRLVREAPDLRDTTKRVYLVDVSAWVAFAGVDPAGWTRHTAKEFYAHLLTRMKARSANRVIAALRYVGHWYATEAGDPNLNFSIIRHKTVGAGIGGASKEGKALTPDEAQRLLAAVVADRWKAAPRVTRDLALFVVALETGMRRMSLESMQIQTLAYQGPLVANVLVKRVKLPYPVALSETATCALEAWLALLRSAKIDKGPVWRSLQRHKNGLVIGAGFTAQAIYDMVCKHGQCAKVELTPHDFRHTFIAWRTAAGWTPQQIAAITGHQLPRSSGTPFANTGAVRSYSDPRVFWPAVSTATPAWLVDFVEQETK